MKNQVIYLDDKNTKVFGYSDDQLVFSSKKHKSFEDLMGSADKSGMLESVKTIAMSTVTGVKYNENDESFTILHDKNGKVKKAHVPLKELEQRDSIVEELASLTNLKKTVEAESKTKPLMYNLIGVLFAAFMTWVARGMAIEAQQGEHYVASGRRSGLKQLFANAVEGIGPTGVTVIGVLAFAYIIYRTYKRWNNPASDIKYSQNPAVL